MPSQSASSAKQKAAEARAAAEAAEKRRQRIINFSIGGVLLLVVLGLVGGAYLSSRSNDDQLQPSADAALPTGALPSGDEYQYGIPSAAASAKPTLEIWEDFQCPACAQFESLFGATINEIATAGDARVIWRSTSFLDANFPGDNSKRAASAWGCAIDAGKGTEFHDLVFANQPATEGEGWTDQQLIAFGEQAGISGEAKATFDKCVTDRTYVQWAVNGTDTMQSEGVPATPGLYLDGVEVTDEQRATPEALKQAIAEAAKSASQ